MTGRRYQLVTFLLSVSLFLIPRYVQGQTRTEGQLTGIVVDPSGAAVPGAMLTLSQASTGFVTVVQANESGVYVFGNVQPGTYSLSVSAKGFATKTYNEVDVYAGRTTDLKVDLKVGTTAETVEVSAASEVLETSTNTLATTVNPDSIQDLPLGGRDILPFAQLVAGAQVGGDLRFTTYNSMPNGAINITVDGANNNFQRFRTSTTGFFEAAALRLGAIDEVTVSTSDLTADAGAEGAVTLRFTTKRGTNQFHGNGFWEAYNSAFNANSFQNDTYLYAGRLLSSADPGTSAGYLAAGRKQPFHTNDFGGNIGGPIIKNKLFFFFNFEWENQPGLANFTEGVLTQSGPACTGVSGGGAQNGCFTYIRADNGAQQTVNLYNIAANAPASIGGPFPSVINPNIQTTLSAVNTLTQGGKLAANTTDVYLQNLQQTLNFTAAQNTKQRWPTGRIDYLVKPHIEWHTSYDLYWRTYPTTPVYPNDPVRIGGFQSSYSTFATGVDWTINPRLVNQANFGILNTQERAQPGSSFDAFKGIAYLPVPSSFAVTGVSAFTPPTPFNVSILPEPRNNPVWTWTDNVTWTHGNHSFTFGGDYRYSNQHDVNTQPPIPENLGISANDPAAGMFNTTTTCVSESQGCFPGGLSQANNDEAVVDAEALYSTLTGRVSSVNGFLPLDTTTKTYKSGGITSIKEKQAVGGFYVQDGWKINPHLALNYGLRWQFSGALVNTNNYFSSPDIPNFYGPSTALFQPGQLNGVANPQFQLRPRTYSSDYKQPSPNFGFAWNPDFENGFLGKLAGGSNLVIRGGFAINHYDEGWIPWENVATGSISNQSVFLNPGSGPGLFTPGSISFDPTGASFPIPPNTLPASFTLPMAESALTFTRDGVFSTVDPNIRNPYIQNWTFGFERKLSGNWALDVNYVGNHAVHMWAAYDLNEVNIFENGFLQDFKNAQANLAANLAANNGQGFAPGSNPTPILSQAFGPPGSSAWTNSGFLFDVQSGQAGALAGAITQTPSYFCNLVGNTFSPCVIQGYVGAGQAPTPTAYPINMFQLNPYSGGQALTLLSDPGSESYNGLQIQVKHPVGHGLNFMANYTYSHSFTNRYIGDFFQADGALMDFFTLRDPKLNRVPSPYDLRHVFRTYFTYELPFGTGKPFKTGNSLVDRVIGGWQVGTIFSMQTGRNFKLAGGVNTYNYFDGPSPANANGTPAGILNYVPNENDSGVVLNGMSVSQVQSKVGVFPGPTTVDNGVTVPVPSVPVVILPQNLFGSGGAIQPSSTPGVLGQTVFLKGPKLVDADISVIKSIPIWERLRFNIYAEFLNAFNHPNFNFIDSYSFGTNNPAQYLLVNSAPYAPGTVGQNGNRQIQFRLQLAF